MSRILLPTEFVLPSSRRVLTQDGAPVGDSPYRDPWKAPNFWQLRDMLLTVRAKTDAAWFLNRAGYAIVVSVPGIPRQTIDLISSPVKPDQITDRLLDFLFRWRNLIREMLLLRPLRWPELCSRFGSLAEYAIQGTGRHNALSASFGWNSSGLPFVKVFVEEALEAIALTVHIDAMRRIRFRQCKRRDCKNLFPIETKHQKLFCSYDCAHVVAVRRSRMKKETRLKS